MNRWFVLALCLFSFNVYAQSREADGTMPGVVDYSMSFEEMFLAADLGAPFDEMNEEHFPINTGIGTVCVEYRLYVYEQRKDPDARRAIIADGFHPANMAELLAFGAQYPNYQRLALIKALGSVWDHEWCGWHYPVLYAWDNGKIRVIWRDNTFGPLFNTQPIAYLGVLEVSCE